MKNPLFCMLLFGLMACAEDKTQTAKDDQVAQKLLGDWRSVSIKITMNSYLNSDSTRVFETDLKTWDDKMQIRPIRTEFKKDGTYESKHFNLSDSLVFKPAGKWHVKGDSIYMRDTFPQLGSPFKYKFRIKDNLLELRGKEDSDGDGKQDDDYYGLQWRK